MDDYDDKMQALDIMRNHLGFRSDGGTDNCRPRILRELDKKTQRLLSNRRNLLHKIQHDGVYDPNERPKCRYFRHVSLRVNDRIKLKTLETQIYSCYALKYVLENVDAWRLLLVSEHTNEIERRALHIIMEKYNKVKNAAWRSDRYYDVQRKIVQASDTVDQHLKQSKFSVCLHDPELERWQAELDEYRAEIIDLRFEQRMQEVLDQKDVILWEKALMWFCYWKRVPVAVRAWVVEYEKLRDEFWQFWKRDNLDYGVHFSREKHVHRNIDSFPSEMTLASYFTQPVQPTYQKLSVAELEECFRQFNQVPANPVSRHQDYICQETYLELYGREFDDFRAYRSDTDSDPNSEHHAGSDSESDAASDISNVSSEWQEETDCYTEHDSVAKQDGPGPSTVTLPVTD